MVLTQLILNGVINGAVYALLALGFLIIYKGVRIFHVSHGALFSIGGYGLVLFYSVLIFPLWVSILLTLLIAMLIGVLMDQLVYKKLQERRSSILVVAIASIGMYIIIANFLALTFGSDKKIILKEVSPSLQLGGIIITRTQSIQLLVASVVTLVVYSYVRFGRFGKYLRAYAENDLLSKAIGFDINKIRAFAFSIGSLMAATAGLLMALDIGIGPWGGMNAFLIGAVAAIMGGIQCWEGAILGGFLLGLLQALALLKTSTMWLNTVTFGLLIAFLLLMPNGLLSRKLRMEEE